MTIVSHSFDITNIIGVGRNSRLPSGVPSIDGSALKIAADAMAPGEFIDYAPILPDGSATYGNIIFRGMTLNNNSADFWGTHSEWDSIQKKVYSVWDRTAGGDVVSSTNMWVYNAITDTWELPSIDFPRAVSTPHTYSRWALARNRRKVYRPQNGLWAYDIGSDTWSQLTTWFTFGGGEHGVAFHEGIDKLLTMNTSGQVQQLDVDTFTVSNLGSPHPTQSGRHCHVIYNPIRGEVAFVSGDQKLNLTLVQADGTVVPQDDIPAEVLGSASQSTLFEFYDPITGNYLFYEQNTRKIYEFNPDTNQWAMAKDLTVNDRWPPYHGFHICPIPEAGIIFWQHRQGMRLYKHNGVL